MNEQLYVCSICDEVFDVSNLGHCPRCGAHYGAGILCKNCLRHVLRKTMRKAPFTIDEWTKRVKKHPVEFWPEITRLMMGD